MKRLLLLLPIALLPVLALGCGGSAKTAAPADKAPAATCPQAWKAGWQRLADRIGSPVYCPGWIASPLDAKIGGGWNTVDSVDDDGSYLVGFAWQERAEEVHVNFRGYPGRTSIPKCIDVQTGAGKTRRRSLPCFADPRGTKRAGDIVATIYTVNRDADQWHILYAWRRDGSLYTLSEHISPPLTYGHVVRNMDRMLRNMVLLEPSS